MSIHYVTRSQRKPCSRTSPLVFAEPLSLRGISRAISSAHQWRERRVALLASLWPKSIASSPSFFPPCSVLPESGVPVNKFTITSPSLTVNCEQIQVECSLQVGVYQLHIRLSAPVNLFELVLFSTALYSYYRVTVSVLEYFNNGWWLRTHLARQAWCSGVPNTAEDDQPSLQVGVCTASSTNHTLTLLNDHISCRLLSEPQTGHLMLPTGHADFGLLQREMNALSN